MGRSLKLNRQDVLERENGRKVIRCFAYMRADVAVRAKTYCFTMGEDFSAFLEKATLAYLATPEVAKAYEKARRGRRKVA